MLFIFNLALEKLDINNQVSVANARMAELVRKKKLEEKIHYNLASMGAGEFKTSFPWLKDEEIAERTLSFLRRMHWRIKRELNKDKAVRLSYEVREMFSVLNKSHTLVAVWAGVSREAQERLKQSRSLDFFGDNVVDYGDAPKKGSDKTGVGLYQEAFRRAKTAPYDSIIVSDTPEGIEEARIVKPFAVVGYVPSCQDWDEKGRQYKELDQAGADHTVIGGHSVCLAGLFVRETPVKIDFGCY